MKHFLDNFDSEIKPQLDNLMIKANDSEFVMEFDENSGATGIYEENSCENGYFGRDVVLNTITGHPYKKPEFDELYDRENDLHKLFKNKTSKVKHDLPIMEFKKEILDAIKDNQVVVISGDTGCGKTTQVPQFIFENAIRNGIGSLCNIIVTQPRRISAISISEFVANEFGEPLGGTVGYQVRFEKVLPQHENGVLLFCSAGILLRRLQSNPKLEGISHVIIDEVHERDVITDFLLVLLKRITKQNKSIRIILMSASMNAHMFGKYFDNCKIFQIPGRCFPVMHYYYDDFAKIINQPLRFVENNPKINKEIIGELVNFIAARKPDGAILIFLPGWKDIEVVMEEIQMYNSPEKPLLVLPVHSKLPSAMQKKIFNRPPAGVRKVILATNIAETSLTIDDVVYVIDPGLCNEMHYDEKLNVCTFGTHWISQANAMQRSGRAGRVQAGECFRIYTKEIQDNLMAKYPTPELLRIPLESVVMDAKLHCPNEKAKEFLSEVPQPPNENTLEAAIKTLKKIKVLNPDESLSILGKRIVGFTIHPRLSAALVQACMFNCYKPVFNIAAALSTSRDPFQTMPNERSKIREIKMTFCDNYMSDHLAMNNLITEYIDKSSYYEVDDFCDQNSLNKFAMKTLIETRDLFASQFLDAKLLNNNTYYKRIDFRQDFQQIQKQLVISCLLSGLYPNVLRFVGGELKNDKIVKKLVAHNIHSWKKVRAISESILQERIDPEINPAMSNALVTYFGSFFSEDAKMLTIRDASVISHLAFLLFTKGEITFDKGNVNGEENVQVLVDDNSYLHFNVYKDDAVIIKRWNDALNDLTNWFALTQGRNYQNEKIDHSLRTFIELTTELLGKIDEELR